MIRFRIERRALARLAVVLLLVAAVAAGLFRLSPILGGAFAAGFALLVGTALAWGWRVAMRRPGNRIARLLGAGKVHAAIALGESLPRGQWDAGVRRHLMAAYHAVGRRKDAIRMLEGLRSERELPGWIRESLPEWEERLRPS